MTRLDVELDPHTATPSASFACELVGVGCEFGGRLILEDLTYGFASGATYVISGPSGVGKSTILHLLAGYLTPDRGRVARSGSVGYVMQEDTLFTSLSVRENVLVELAGAGIGAGAEGMIDEALGALRIGGLAENVVASLSGGERQRLQLAGTLIRRPDVVLMDEPTSSLDDATRDDVAGLIAHALVDSTVIIVSHDQSLAERIDGSIRLRLVDRRLEHG